MNNEIVIEEIDSKIESLIDGTKFFKTEEKQTKLIYFVENQINSAISSHGNKTNKEQKLYIHILEGLDRALLKAGVSKIPAHERLQVAYAQLRQVPDTKFWTGGGFESICSFREKEIWAKLDA